MIFLRSLFWMVATLLLATGFSRAELLMDAARPADGIYDPTGLISDKDRAEMARDLASMNENAGIDILVVFLDDTKGMEVERMAEKLAAKWGHQAGRALILIVPNQPDSPWIHVSGLIRNEIPAGSLDDMIREARIRGRTGKSPNDSARKTISSLGDEMLFQSARSARKLAAPAKLPDLDFKTTILLILVNSKKLILTVILGIVFLVFAISVVVTLWKKFWFLFSPKRFPDVVWKQRFGAPHSGLVFRHSRKKSSDSNK